MMNMPIGGLVMNEVTEKEQALADFLAGFLTNEEAKVLGVITETKIKVDDANTPLASVAF